LDANFKKLVNALKEGDLDKIPKLITMVMAENDSNDSRLILSTPLFIDYEPTHVEDGVIYAVRVELYYFGWKVIVGLSNEKDNVSYSYSIISAEKEGVYAND